MRVLGAQDKTTQRAFVKDSEARRTRGGCLDDLLGWLGVVCHFSIVLRGEERRGDVWAYRYLLRFDLK
jgi:hypothetical protein